MANGFSVIGPNLYMDAAGKLFTKTAGEIRPVKNTCTEAEDRFVRKQLSKGVNESEATV